MQQDAARPRSPASLVPGARSSLDGPAVGFDAVAAAVIDDLEDRTGLDLWMVTRLDGDDQVVVASSGAWQELAQVGSAFGWAQSFCKVMVDGGGPVAVPDVAASPTHAKVAVGRNAVVKAYLGVPLECADGEVYGSLCAYHGSPTPPPELLELLPHATLQGRLLSRLLVEAERTRALQQEAARARALADRDHLTDLRNRRAWEDALVGEEGRATRHGHETSLLVLDLDGLKQINDAGGHAVGDVALVRCAEVLSEAVRPHDLVARLGGDEFGVLAVECSPDDARALAGRLSDALAEADVEASVGVATRAAGEDLWATWRRADASMYRAKRAARR